MKRPDRHGIDILLAAAVLSLAAGTAAWVRAAAHVRAARSEIRRMTDDLARVREAERKILEADALLNMFAAGVGHEGRGETPSAILRRLSPELPAEFTDPEVVADTPAGRLVRREWLLDDTAAEPVFLFAAVCERQRPPWKVDAMRLQAVPGRPGRVRGGIAFIGLDALPPDFD